MKCHIPLHFLHGLMNVAVQYSDGAEVLQVAESLRTILGSPSPLGINGPQRNVREHYYGRAFGEMFNVFFQPLQLLRAQRSEVPCLQAHHIHEADKMHSNLVQSE